jgi:hypothetical protein
MKSNVTVTLIVGFLMMMMVSSVSSFQVTSTTSTNTLAPGSRTLSSSSTSKYTTQLYVINKNKKKTKLTKEELSYLETRDMTREEMLELNAQNERVMNQELTYMTIFSLIISAPLLYLAWVGFFAETAEIAMQ